MKRLFNIAFVALYMIAAAFIWAAGMARISFYREWVALWDALMLIGAALFVIIFYGALLIAHKKQYLERWSIHVLCWTDAVIFGLQIIGIVLAALLPLLFGRLSWGQALPVVLCNCLLLLLRLLSTRFLVKKSENG